MDYRAAGQPLCLCEVERDGCSVRGLEDAVEAGAPKFLKSLNLDHARDGEVMIAFGMNGEQLLLLNGFLLKLIVPGRSGVYCIKMLNDIEVHELQACRSTLQFFRSFITNIRAGDTNSVDASIGARGIPRAAPGRGRPNPGDRLPEHARS